MSMNDPLGDMLTRIRNAQMRGKSTVSSPASKLRAWVLDVLTDEGYIRGYDRKSSENGQGELVLQQQRQGLIGGQRLVHRAVFALDQRFKGQQVLRQIVDDQQFGLDST